MQTPPHETLNLEAKMNHVEKLFTQAQETNQNLQHENDSLRQNQDKLKTQLDAYLSQYGQSERSRDLL